MARRIDNIKVLKNTVYVDFSDGTFGMHFFEDGKWHNSGIAPDELAAAKKLAVKNGKWTNWRAPRQAPREAPREINPPPVTEEEDADMEAYERVRREDARRDRNQPDDMFDSMYGIEG